VAESTPLRPHPDTSTLERLTVDLLDLYDELNQSTGKEPAARAMADFVKARLQECLERAGGEIIDDDVWNPLRQRAVGFRDAATIAPEAQIIEKVAAGLFLRGVLHKKQEVVLNHKPEQ
jgi:SOS-response transcriptional repressor LexA